jgi:hypothetical protein
MIDKDMLTPEICLEAVKQNGYALQYISNQTPEICLEAVKQNGYAIHYVINQTPEICLAAVKQCGSALHNVINQTPEICLEAVKQNGTAIQWIRDPLNKDPELCIKIVKHNGLLLQYLSRQTPEICLSIALSIALEAVKQNGLALQYVSSQTFEICMEAVKQNGNAIQYIKDPLNQTPELYLNIALSIALEAVKQNGLALQYVSNQTPEMCLSIALEAVKQNGLALKYVINQTPEICMEAVKQNGIAIQFVKEPIELYKLAYQQAKYNIFKFIDFNKFNIEDIIGKVETTYTNVKVSITDKFVYKNIITGTYNYVDKKDTIHDSIIEHINLQKDNIDDLIQNITFITNASDMNQLPNPNETNEILFYVLQVGNTYELYKKYNEIVDVGIFLSNKVQKPKIEKIGEYFDPQL